MATSSSGAARAAVIDTGLASPLAFVELDLAQALHAVSPTPLALAANDNVGEAGSWSIGCGCGCGKRYTDFFQDGVGDGPRPAQPPMLLVTTDSIPGDTSTTQALTVDGSHFISTIDTLGDEDFYSVQLVEGQTYDISMFLVVGGPSGVPLVDAYIELYDSLGELVVTADGGGPNTPSGLDAILTYTAQSSGVFYINARAYDNAAENGTTGDFVGDYEVFVTSVDASDPSAYVPFYSPDSPLHSIDWGSQFTRSSRNPDGDNGTRTDNGVPNGGTPIDNNPYGIVGKNVITYYFAETGDIFVSEDPTNPGLTENIVAQGMQDWEMQAFETAFAIYEEVADIEYVRVNDRAEADIKIITYEGTPGVGASLLGRMSPPGEQNAGQMEINSGDVRWTEEGVSQGGFYFPTLLHELGHGHGMAHPHDNGGRSGVMRGAEPSDDPVEGAIGGQFGDYGLSQQVFTIMSYNDGWQEGIGEGGAPDGHGRPRSGGITGTEVDHFGWVGTLSALDIAVLQDKYGVNEEWATGDDVYVIADVNQEGAFYSTIWDGGGADEIRYMGARNASIDLRAATLRYEEGGGGRVSYALGAWTGFTIANGVVIERAAGGDGDDLLHGNGTANVLDGGLGSDVLKGGAGGDVLIGGGGGDLLIGGQGEDTADYASAGAGVDVRLAQGEARDDGQGGRDSLHGIENVRGSAFDDLLVGDGLANLLSGGAGYDQLVGGDGDDVLIGGSGAGNKMKGGAGDDVYVVTASDTLVELANQGVDTVETTLGSYKLRAHFENLEFTGSGRFTGSGNDLDNVITGGAGDDVLIGGVGDDHLIGGDGNDLAVLFGVRADYTVALESDGVYRVTDGVGGRDGVDLMSGVERIRFGDGSTVLLADLPGSASSPPSSASERGHDGLILPGLSDDDFIVLNRAGGPLIQPDDGLIDGIGTEALTNGRFGGEAGRMLTLFDEQFGFLAEPAVLLKHTDGLDDWM